MRALLPNLHRIIGGLALVGSVSFGVTQAFATPGAVGRAGTCEWNPNGPYFPGDICYNCEYGGYCDGFSSACVCYEG